MKHFRTNFTYNHSDNNKMDVTQSHIYQIKDCCRSKLIRQALLKYIHVELYIIHTPQ